MFSHSPEMTKKKKRSMSLSRVLLADWDIATNTQKAFFSFFNIRRDQTSDLPQNTKLALNPCATRPSRLRQRANFYVKKIQRTKNQTNIHTPLLAQIILALSRSPIETSLFLSWAWFVKTAAIAQKQYMFATFKQSFLLCHDMTTKLQMM